MRKLRHVPSPGQLMEVTTRCVQARYLLRPSKQVNDIIAGVLGRAQRLYEVEVIASTALSNHLHCLLKIHDAEQMAFFMRDVKSNIAKELGRAHHWQGPFWEKRYTSIPVSDEEAAQVARLKYILEQGSKENLVTRPTDWPGINAGKVILAGGKIVGSWLDRTGLCKARARVGAEADPRDYRQAETLTFSPLPCWAHLSADEYRRRVRHLIDDIEQETIKRHQLEGTEALGRSSVLKADPRHKPETFKQSPAPLVHAASKGVRRILIAAYCEFVSAFRLAAKGLRQGARFPAFPEGCFPPGLPFVKGPCAARAG